MSEDKIKKTEVDLLSTAISRIISSEVLQSIMSNQLPLTNDLTDSNKIYCGKASILFLICVNQQNFLRSSTPINS